ncbi:bacteriorhodopsin-like [Kineosporia sp. R_H_3]|uniref:bacteriorhodopsin-like n=1 Tax=Kineosporia sp. R_H_3 TaxID=1961848 RepID=UPI0018E94997|nr:bacteriorhodopsin-like [Kineosporia sp. R_H_3]
MAFNAAAEFVPSLSAAQFSTVYNLFSLVIASMLFTAIYLLVSQRRVAPRYRNALVVSAIVCGIAAYHYIRIFNNFGEAYPAGATVDDAHLASNVVFNEGYRYVDWLLTVPLLLIETVAVMALARDTQRKLLFKLVPASALMIVLGYPGEISGDFGTRALWGFLSTIPFVYLLWVLFVELSRSLDRQPPEVVHTIKMLRISLVGLWGVYPIAYMFPMIGGDFFGGPDGFVLRQAGYSIADILAKAAYGLAIYKIARVKSRLEDPAYDDDHASTPVAADPRPVAA